MTIRTTIFCLFAFYITACAQKNTTPTVNYNYEESWKIVQENDNKGLPESALKTVEEIYKQAEQDNDPAQMVKALIHRLKYIDSKEENALVLNLNTMKAEAEKATFPSKPLLHSLLAEMYWRYYQNHRHQFYNRSETVEFDNDDLETWSLDRIVQETVFHYEQSLLFEKESKETSIELYQEVLHEGNALGRAYRPTLYDFLAHRAIQFYSSGEPDITRPSYEFTLDQAAYFSEASSFSRLKIQSEDSLSLKFHAIALLQNLIQFHLNDKNPDALVDVDLQRLQFVRQHSVVPEKTALYGQALQKLESKLLSFPISTLVSRNRAQLWMESATQYKSLVSDDHKWDYKRAMEICDSAIARFPNSSGAVLCKQTQHIIRTKTIRAAIEENNLPDQPFRAFIQYKNFTDLHYRIIAVTSKEVQDLRARLSKDREGRQEERFIENFIKKPVVKSGNFTLPNDDDFQEHSIEVKLDALPVGEYMVLFSNQEDFSIANNGLAYAFTRITNISYINRSVPDGSTDFFVLHRETGVPLAGVSVEVLAPRYNYRGGEDTIVKIGDFTTDTKGFFRVPFQGKDNRDFIVWFSKDKDRNSTLSIDFKSLYYGGNIYQYKQNALTTRTETFFFLDRAIYRPGQTIYFKGLVIQTDGKNPEIKKKYSTTIKLMDVNYQEKGSVTVTTNEFGSFSGTFTAPSGGLMGQMQLNTEDQSGQVSFSVEEYKRPKFEVGFDAVTGLFRLEDTVKANGFARAYSGANIDGAQVQYRVVRTARFPFWYYSRHYYPSSSEVEITNGVTTTDANGKFVIDFSALPDRSIDPKSDPTFDFMVYADVTDINGETHSSSTVISVGYKALQVGVSIDDINLDDTLPKEFSIYTRNLAGSFEPAKGEIKIYPLEAPKKAFRTRMWEQPDRHLYSEAEYYSLFPNDLYADETNKFTWPRKNQELSLAFDTEKEKSFSVADLKNWTPGEYVLEITSTDRYGQSVKEIVYFKVYSSSAKKLAIPSVNDFSAIKLTAEPGEQASFVAGTSKAINVLYEVEQDGKLLSSEWIKLNDQQKIFEIPIKESHRGNLAIHYSFIKDNRLYSENAQITVPFSNKDLDISFETFRDKLLPGQQEQWKINIKGNNTDKVLAEMVATMYDASLDEFRSNNWYAGFFHTNSSRLNWTSGAFTKEDLKVYTSSWNPSFPNSPTMPNFDSFNWFGYNFYYSNRDLYKSMSRVAGVQVSASGLMEVADSAEIEDEISISLDNEVLASPVSLEVIDKISVNGFSEIKTRSNFNETAFFFPHLRTNEKGEISINFTVPESLTRWKILGFAHTPDLKSGKIMRELVTQKDLMVVPNQPRFFRESDKMIFSAKVSSLVDENLSGEAQLEFFDALTMKPVSMLQSGIKTTQSFSILRKQSTVVEWSIEIPEGLQALQYRIVAKAGNFSDGEEMVIPVVTNRMLVTETMPLPIRGKQTKTFTFDKLLNNKSTTLKHNRYTLEFTSNPAWYAVQALPYMMEYPYECVEQTFSRYYANSIASHIANSNPRIKQVFDTWKNIQPDALLSNLEKNQELKSALLEETPWVLEGKDESQRKRAVGLLFDLNRMANEQERALSKIVEAQTSNGGFSWFPGFREDRYMTQHIVTGLGHLNVMGVKASQDNEEITSLIENAVGYMDRQIKEDYDELKKLARQGKIKLEDKHIGYMQIHYLYARSYFKNTVVPDNTKEAFDYYIGQAEKYWLHDNLYTEGMLALALHRFGDRATPAAMIKSFSERALQSEEMGMYWKSANGYYWYQAPIERQALMIEVYDEVAGDQQSVEALKVWLLKQKQTQDWKTTRATAEACYALLRRGVDGLASSKLVDVTVGNIKVDPTKREDTKVEAGTGYFKTSWQGSEITSEMGKITVSKSDDGVAWGAVYWQYFEQLDKITTAETPLQLKKELFVEQQTDRGPVITPISKVKLKVGDLIKVRIEIRVDRAMEYVHLKDMRASAFEPVSTLSTSKYQDGLYYYESPKDLSTNFFIGYLPKGTFVFEYALRVSQKGDFSNGITTIQCMYAPEFSSHSEGVRVKVD